MGFIKFPGSTGDVSDGYHTFDELYDHRYLLFIAFALEMPKDASWKFQDDNPISDGYFLVGLSLPQDDGFGKEHIEKSITYHIPNKYWNLCNSIRKVDKSPEFDGHTSADVLDRIKSYIIWSSS